jgi:hypothetical protein
VRIEIHRVTVELAERGKVGICMETQLILKMKLVQEMNMINALRLPKELGLIT